MFSPVVILRGLSTRHAGRAKARLFFPKQALLCFSVPENMPQKQIIVTINSMKGHNEVFYKFEGQFSILPYQNYLNRYLNGNTKHDP